MSGRRASAEPGKAVSEADWRALCARPGAQALHQAREILLRPRDVWEWEAIRAIASY